MEPTFKLTITGIQPNQSPQTIQERLRALLKGSPTEIENTIHRILSNQPVMLAEHLPQAKADQLLEKLTDKGLVCRIDPMQLTLAPIEAEEGSQSYKCPACGHKQPQASNGPDICERCGVVGRNYEAVSEFKQALELERRRLNRETAYNEAQEAREAARKRQEELQARARRQVEKEMGITTKEKLKAFLKPRILVPVLTSMTFAAAGIGLLVWKLGADQSTTATADAKRGSGIQINIATPNTVVKVEGAGSQIVQGAPGSATSPPTSTAGAPSPGAPVTPQDPSMVASAAKPTAGGVGSTSTTTAVTTSTVAASTGSVATTATAGAATSAASTSLSSTQTTTALTGNTSKPTAPATGATAPTLPGAKPSTVATAATAPPDAKPSTVAKAATATTPAPEAKPSTVATASATAVPSTAKPGAPLGPAPDAATPTALISFDKVALASPTSATAKTRVAPANTSNLQLLTSLARYQAETGDLSAADQTLLRATELLNADRNQSDMILDAFNRNQVEIRATIARQQHQRQAVADAQAQWYRTMNLANAITTPGERIQAFAHIALTLQDADVATASNYFNRALENTRTVKDPISRAIALSAIARNLAGAGRFKQAEDLFTQAKTAAAALTDAQSRLTTLGVIARDHAEAGDTTVARNLLNQIADESVRTTLPSAFNHYRADARSAIARNLAAKGDLVSARAEFTAVLSQIMALENPDIYASAMLYLARNLAAAGDSESATRIVADTLQKRGVSTNVAKPGS